ncbi:hypothetical protein DAETH_28750 [Deinococcus aetherius]|uniref:Uncharacterized protein n=2 Tax=Deinococcus aetherius TaxID=200252 RepID=A0ABN6RKU5_9DEIO|nr:hypothetical protein DAETH_28750 [Deinococcus aetherius]
MLAQRMREARWVNAQVKLVGKVQVETPDPISLLDILGVYELDNRSLRAARAALTPAQREQVLAYLVRPDLLVERADQDGSRRWVSVPPEMWDSEADAFRALWHNLSRMGTLRRLPPRPTNNPESAPTAE